MLFSSSTTRTLLSGMCLLSIRRGGQIDADCRAFARAALDAYTAAVLFDDLLGVRHPEAEPLTLRRVERLEDAAQLLLGHADARVGYLDAQRVRRAAGLDAQASAARHRLQGVED